MSIDLKLLVWSSALALIQVVIAVFGAMLQVGLPALAGNRDDVPPLKGWAGRAERAHLNLIENLVVFAILVLIAQVTGKANATTALGSQLFFWARVAYVPVYLLGIPWLRTGLWGVSIIGLILIFTQLL
jgi:uncharacterized MAPEG superfamily protein